MENPMNEKEIITRIAALQNEKLQIKMQIMRDKTVTKHILLLRQQELNHKRSVLLMLLVLWVSYISMSMISHIINPLQYSIIYPAITAIGLAMLTYFLMSKYYVRNFIGQKIGQKIQNVDKLYITQEKRIQDIDKEIMDLEEIN